MEKEEVVGLVTQNVSVPAWAILAVIALMIAIWYISRGCPKVNKYKKELEKKEVELNKTIDETKQKIQGLIDKL